MARDLSRVLRTRLRAANEANDHQLAARLETHLLQLSTVRNDGAGARVVRELASDHSVEIARRTVQPEHTAIASSSTSVTGGGITHTRTQELSSTSNTHGPVAGSPTETHTSRRTTAVSLDDNGVGHTSTTTERHEHSDGSSREASRATTHGASMNETGASLRRGTTNTTTNTDADNNQTARSSGGTTTGGVSYDDNGINGVRLGRQGRSSTTVTRQRADDDVQGPESTPVRSSTTTGGVDGAVTDHGASASGNAARTETHGPASFRVQAGLNGGVDVNIEPAPGGLGRFQVVTTVTFGGNAGGTVGASRGGTGVSVGGEMTASRSTVYRHTLSAEEATRYASELRQVAAGHGNSTAHPEFNWISRIRAHHDHGSMPSSALHDPAAAAAMSPGSSIEQTDTFGGTARGSASLGTEATGVGVSGSTGGTVTRATRVSDIRANGRHLVEIRLTFTDAQTSSMGAHGRIQGAAIEASHSTSHDDGRVVSVRLDPAAANYRAQYDRVMAAHSLADAERLATDMGAGITRSENDSQTTSMAAGLAGDGGVGTGGTRAVTHSSGQTVAVGAADPITGQRTLSGDVTGASSDTLGLRVAGTEVARSAESATATGHADADGATVDITHDQTDSVGVIPQSAAQFLGLYQRELQSIRFTDGEIDELGNRARSADGWYQSLSGAEMLHISGPWIALGNALRNPQPDRAWGNVDRTVAVRLVRVRAISRFIGAADPQHGHAALRNVATNANGTHLGRELEWPQGISGRARQFQQLEERVDGAAATYRGSQGAERVQRIEADVRDIQTQCQSILTAIRAATFTSSRARVSTETAVHTLISRIEHIANEALPNRAHAAEGPAGQAELEGIKRQVTVFKQEEMRRWRSAQAGIGSSQHWYSGYGGIHEATAELAAIADTYPAWVQALHQGYAVLQQAGGDPAALRRCHPNAEWSIELLRQAAAAASPTIRDNMNVEGRAASWRAAARV